MRRLGDVQLVTGSIRSGSTERSAALSVVASESGDHTSFIAGEGGSNRGCSFSRSSRVANRGGQSSCWLSEWARSKASVHNWKKWLRSLNPNSRTTRSSRSRFSSRTRVVRFGFCCNLAVEVFSMARCSHAALRSEKIGAPFEQPCDATGYYREGQSEYFCYQL